MTSMFVVLYSGVLNKDDFELLLMALGHNLTQNELDACLHDIGVDAKKNEGTVSFDLFFEWWTDSMGVEAIRKKASKNSKK
jgi:Ca2+-binding EF-hand superfamily protein